MIKKSHLLISIVLGLIGCSNQSPQSDEPTVDESIFHYSISYQQTNNGLQSLRNIALHEQGVFVQIRLTDGGAVIGFYDEVNDKFDIIHNNPTVSCTINKPTTCSSYAPNLYGQASLFYYNQKLYVIQKSVNIVDDTEEYNLLQMNLDGSDHRIVLTLEQPDHYLSTTSQGVPNIYFHQGYVYYSFGEDFIKKYNALTWKEVEFAPYLAQAKNIYPFFKEKEQYIMAGEFFDNKQYQDVFIKSNGSYTIINEGIWVFALTEEGYIYWDSKVNEDNTHDLYYKSFNSDTTTYLDLGPAFILTNKDRIVIDQHFSPWISEKRIILLNTNGEVLDEITSQENIDFTGGHILTETRYYTYWRNSNDDMIFGYIDIVDDKFQKPIEISVVGSYG